MKKMSFPNLPSLIIILLGAMPISSYSRYNLKTKPDHEHDIKRSVVSRIITVDQQGRGDFTTVQKAIDNVPKNNQFWILIHIRAGIYIEKVTIDQDKPFIVLEGESSRRTIIAFEDGGNVIESSTFKMYANDFVARDISFVNTYNHEILLQQINEPPGRKITWAPAALIMGDRASFYRCGFISIQDTLSDLQGRHYYESCYIEGAIDFIWGNAQSFYLRCNINATTSILGRAASFITAQGRDSPNEETGFVFHSSHVLGTGPSYLGRPYRRYSRVLFFKTVMDNIVIPQGWDRGSHADNEELITYAEVGCLGPGSDKSRRVSWEKQLGIKELDILVHVNKFINRDRWLESQP